MSNIIEYYDFRSKIPYSFAENYQIIEGVDVNYLPMNFTGIYKGYNNIGDKQEFLFKRGVLIAGWNDCVPYNYNGVSFNKNYTNKAYYKNGRLHNEFGPAKKPLNYILQNMPYGNICSDVPYSNDFDSKNLYWINGSLIIPPDFVTFTNFSSWYKSRNFW